MSQMTERGKKTSDDYKTKRKNRMIKAIIAVTALAAVAAMILYLPDLFLHKGKKNVYPEVEIDESKFYMPEWYIDLSSDAEYMEHDLNLYMKKSGEEIGYPYGSTPEGTAEKFFMNYFELLRTGDIQAYNKLFTDRFNETYTEQKKFAPQKVYDTHITFLEQNSSTKKVIYAVEYKISDNNGTFRTDIESDMSRRLIFTLAEADDTLMIDDITY